MASSHYIEVTRTFLERLEAQIDKHDDKLSAIARKRRLELDQHRRTNAYEPVLCCKACGSKNYTIKTVCRHESGARATLSPATINLLKCGVCHRVTKTMVNSLKSVPAQVERERLGSEAVRQSSIDTSTSSHQDSASHQHKMSSKQRAKMRKDKVDLRKLLDKNNADDKKIASRLTLGDFLKL